MGLDFINQKVNIPNVITLLKVALFGLLIGEVHYLSAEVSWHLIDYIKSGNHEYVAIWLGSITFLLTVAYPFVRGCIEEGVKIYKSLRFDLLGILLLGFFMSVSIGGIFTSLYESIISELNTVTIIFIIALPIGIGIALITRAFQIKLTTKKDEQSFFISDIEGNKKATDLLNYADSATRFAERVYNRGSSESIVFGIDAPWGIGKSTFVNYCIESWKEKRYEDDVVIYKFNPLRYEDRTNLLEKFIDGLVATLQKSSFAPEIRPLVSKYSRLIKTKTTFSFFGIEIGLSSGSYTVDDAFDDLKLALDNLDKKVIVVVDDLDRLNFSAIKDVLFAIKKSFTLPNISYVLCYDTENIVAFEKDNSDIEKIREFLEKFVNVKISLFLDSETLSNYVEENYELALQNNLQIDPYTKDIIRMAIEVLCKIYKSPDFYHYQSFLGDVRKLKRLINAMMLFEFEIDPKNTLENTDFDRDDLLHLILIYINYPNIFRKIYNTETGGRRGFFSVVTPYDEEDYPTQTRTGGRTSEELYENSIRYTKYLEGRTDNEKFLLNKVFQISSRVENRRIESIEEPKKRTLACFNGDMWGSGKNLEEYLKLIVKLAKPQKRNQYTFYLKIKEEIKNGVSIKEIFEREEDFHFTNTESTHEQLWRILVNSSHEFDPKIGSNLITFLLENMQNYSFFTNKDIGVGLRDDIDFFLVKLLDTVGWSDSSGGHTDNANENNLAEIAEWIFGEGRHQGSGVLETLSKEDRGVIGLYDLVAFRLFCSADRGGDIFNLQRALIRHADPSTPADINDVVKEMREISQRTFLIFKDQYIVKSKNIFSIIENLTLGNFAGKYFSYIEEQIKLGKITSQQTDEYIASLKSRMKAFITFQLGNTMISHGVGCGYYDETGNDDQKGIALAMNNYLFNQCFNPEISIENYEHFLDYLLINFANIFMSRKGREYIPNISEFTKVLDRVRLASYWEEHSEAIRKLNLDDKEKTIYAGNYTASYKEDLNDVFAELDKLLKEIRIEKEAEVSKEEAPLD